MRCLRRRDQPHRPGGRLAGQGVQAGEARQEARPLLPPAGSRRTRTTPSGRSSARSRTRSASSSPPTCAPSPMPTRCSRASSTASTSTPPPTASATSTTTACPTSSRPSAPSGWASTTSKPDIIGRSYEYLIRKFAEGSGQSAGEFYTPAEVGIVMARIMDPEPGMDIYDPCCGSAGLLIKCELVLDEKMDLRSKKKYAPAQALRPGIHRRAPGRWRT